MATFSTNQNRHLYVANAYKATPNDVKATGDIALKVVDNGLEKEIYFVYKGPDTVLTSDRIQVKNLNYVKAVKKEDLRTPLKSVLVSLDSDVNGGKPVSGQDYILRIVLRQWYGMSDEDVYFKEGAVHALTNMEPKAFYDAMVKSLNLCFAREVGANKDSNPYLKFESTEDGILITEKPQPWTLGIEAQEPVLFEAVPTTVFVDGGDVIWGKVETKTPKKGKDGTYTPALVVEGDTANALGDGTKIADLEYFCMGERGDQYRMIGFPNYIPTTYLVDASKEYNTLEIHHAFTDTGVNSYRSEKEITIVSTDADVINSLVKDINKVGLQAKDLSGTVPATTEG